tara:strand:+ start:918 stop:1190 length:273 start_codon:yes stop_codon:yes gene_type:complete
LKISPGPLVPDPSKAFGLEIKDVPVFQDGTIIHIIDEIGELKNLNYYVPYHEQSMAMSVDAYSRIRGFGVGCVTSGTRKIKKNLDLISQI